MLNNRGGFELVVNHSAIGYSIEEETNELTTKINWGLVIFLFCAIFAPPFLPYINFLIPTSLFAIYQIIVKYQAKIIINLSMKTFFILMLASYFIVFLTMGINALNRGDEFINHYFTVIYRLLILIPLQLICIYYVLLEARKKKLAPADIIKHIIMAGLIQVIIGVIAFLNDSVKLLLIDVMQSNTGSDIYYNLNAYSYGFTYRHNGFAATLLDTFGYGTGIIAGLSMIVGFCTKPKYLLFAPILLLAPFLNARTGILIAFLGLILAFKEIFIKISMKKLIYISIISSVMLVFIFIIGYFIYRINPNTLLWVYDGFSSLFAFFSGGEVQQYSLADHLFADSFWEFPDTLTGILFGRGHTAYGIRSLIGFHSDVGYVNHIWLTGIFGTIFLYIPYIYIFWSSIKSSISREEKTTTIFFFISFFIMLVKADILGYNSGLFVSLLVSFSIINLNNG